MPDTIELVVEDSTKIAAEDVAAIEKLIRYYLSSADEFKSILNHAPGNQLQRMAEQGQLTKKLLGPLTKAILIETAEGLYASDPEDYCVGWMLRNNWPYIAAQIELLKGLVHAGSRVLTVGAHIGTHAIPLARVCLHVDAVEANPVTFDLLEINIKLNGISNCYTHPVAANDKKEGVRFLLNRANSGGSKRKPLHDNPMYNYDHPGEIVVPGMPLDALLGDRVYDLIVMDIEGSEYFALKGMMGILSKAQHLVMEFLPHHLRNVSAVTVEELLKTLPAFQSLTVPSLKKTVGREAFPEILHYLYDNDIGDDGIIFSK
jgi:FkbM family methyltransferase